MDYDVKFTFDVPKIGTFVVSKIFDIFADFLGSRESTFFVPDFYDDQQDFGFEVLVSRI